MNEAVVTPIHDIYKYIKVRQKQLDQILSKSSELSQNLTKIMSDRDMVDDVNYEIKRVTEGELDFDEIESSLRLFKDGSGDYNYLQDLLSQFNKLASEEKVDSEYLTQLFSYIKQWFERSAGEHGIFSRYNSPYNMAGRVENVDWDSLSEHVDSDYSEIIISFLKDVTLFYQVTNKFFKDFQRKLDETDEWKKQVRDNPKGQSEYGDTGHGIPSSEDVETLYHASINAHTLAKTGFQSNFERKGMGGGPDDTTSFTHDFEVARTIARTLRDIVAIANGELTGNTVMQWWRDDGLDLKKELEDPEYRNGFDPGDPYQVFYLYNRYLWFNNIRENPLLMDTSKEFFQQFKGSNLKDIGIISAKVNMKHPGVSYNASEKEFRVHPDSILGIEKVM